MFRSLIVAIIASSTFAVGAANAQAQAEAPPIRLLGVGVEKHRTVAGFYEGDYSSFQGVRSIYSAPQGKVFLTVRIAAAPATPESEGSLEQKNVKLVIGKETIKFLGEQRRDGIASLHGALYTPFESGREKPIRVDLTYLVPETAKAATLTIAGIEKELDLDVPVAQRLKAQDAMKATVEETKLVSELPHSSRLKDGIARRYAPPRGKLLAVTFTVQPLADNTDEGRFRADGEAFGLTLPDGTYLVPVGSIRRDSFYGSPDSVYSDPEPDGGFAPKTITSVFVIPDGTQSAAICYYADPIAQVKIPAQAR